MSQNGKRPRTAQAPTRGACLTSKQKDKMPPTSKTHDGKMRWAGGEGLRVSQSDFLPDWGRRREAHVKRAARNPRAGQKKPEHASNPAGAIQPFQKEDTGQEGNLEGLQPRKRSVAKSTPQHVTKIERSALPLARSFPCRLETSTQALCGSEACGTSARPSQKFQGQRSKKHQA